MTDTQQPICELRVSPFRTAIGFAILVSLGALLLYLALSQTPASLVWLALLLAFGIGSLVTALRFLRATRLSVILRPDGLYQSDGAAICTLEAIRSVERGAFAFKPSNGFLVRLHGRAPAGWVPGLWWRFGKMVGVGGITPAAQGKFMADMIAAMIAERSK